MSKDKPPLTDKINEFLAILPLENNFFNLKSPVCLLCVVSKACKGYHYVPRYEQYKIGEKNTGNSWFWKWVFTYQFTTVSCVRSRVKSFWIQIVLIRRKVSYKECKPTFLLVIIIINLIHIVETPLLSLSGPKYPCHEG